MNVSRILAFIVLASGLGAGTAALACGSYGEFRLVTDEGTQRSLERPGAGNDVGKEEVVAPE